MNAPVAIVTGASSGIGEATARALAATGHTVYAAARRTDRMKPLAAAGIRVAALDVTDDASMVALVEQVASEEGRIDVLVNNAGYGSYGAVEDVSMEEARRQVEVNLFGLARMTQLVTPHMRERRNGTIVNISSMGGRFAEPLGGWYHATKYAVEGLSDSLRMELAPFGIHVVIIEPGAISTEWGDIAQDTLAEASAGTAYASQARALKKIHDMAYGRAAVGPEVVAEAIVRAVTASNPKARYAAPFSTAVMLRALKHLPDRTPDLAIKLATRSR